MKILGAIMGCELHSQNGFHQAIRQTWGSEFQSKIGDLRFFVGRGELGLQPDEVRVDAPDNKETLIYKVVEIFRYALANGYDAIFKVNTCTYANVDVLMRFGHWNHDYAGAPIGMIGNRYPATDAWAFIQGSSSWISARAARLIVDDLVPYALQMMPKLMPFNGRISPYLHSEDLWIGQVITPHLHGLSLGLDKGYGNGPITFWSQSNYIKRVCLSEWMHALHDVRSDAGRMQAVQEHYRSLS